MKQVLLLTLLMSLLFGAEGEKTTQGYAQYKSLACDISIKKALKFGLEDAISSRCECYKQDGNDWLCFTTIKSTK